MCCSLLWRRLHAWQLHNLYKCQSVRLRRYWGLLWRWHGFPEDFLQNHWHQLWTITCNFWAKYNKVPNCTDRYLWRFDHAMDSFHCQCPLQGTSTLYQSLWSFIFRLEIILPPQLIRTQEYLKFSANALQVSNPGQPDNRLWLRDILPPNATNSDKSWCSFLLSRAALAAILVSILASLYSR